MDTAPVVSPSAEDGVASGDEIVERSAVGLSSGLENTSDHKLAQEQLQHEQLQDGSDDVDSEDEDESVGEDDTDAKHSSPTDSPQANSLSSLGGHGNLAASKQLTSRYRGVCWNKKNKRWQAAINTQGKYLYLGSYTSEEQAARAFDLAAVKLRGARAKLNFVYSDYLDKDGNLIDEAKLDLLTGGSKDGAPKKVIRRRRPRARRNLPTYLSTNVTQHQLLSLLGLVGSELPNSNKFSNHRQADSVHDTAAAQQELLQKAALLLTLASGNNSTASLQSQMSADPGIAKTLSSLGDVLRNLGSSGHNHEQHLSSHLMGSLGASSSLAALGSAGHNLQPLLQLQQQQQHQQQHQQQQQHHHHHHHQAADLQRHMMHSSGPSQPSQSHELLLHSTSRGISQGTGQLAISSIEALLPNSSGDMQCLIYRSSHCFDRLSCAVINSNGVHELGAYDSLGDAQQAGLATMKLLEKLGKVSSGSASSSGRLSLEQQQLEAAHQGLGGAGRSSSGSGGMVQLSLLHGAGGRASPDASRTSPKLLMLAAQAQQQSGLSGLLAGYESSLARQQEQDTGPMQSYNELLLSPSAQAEGRGLSWGLHQVAGQKRRYTWDESEQPPEPKRHAGSHSHAPLEGQQLLSVVLGGGNNSRGVQDVVQSLLQQASLLQTAPSQA